MSNPTVALQDGLQCLSTHKHYYLNIKHISRDNCQKGLFYFSL